MVLVFVAWCQILYSLLKPVFDSPPFDILPQRRIVDIMHYELHWHLFNFLMLSGLCHLWAQTLQHPQLCPQFSDSTGLTAASISLLWRRHCCLQPYFCSSLHISYHLALLLILWNCLVCVSGRRWCACGCDGLRIPLQPDMLGERHILSLRKATKLHLWTDRGMKCHKQPLHRRNTSHRQHRQTHKDTALSKLRSLPPVEILNPIIQPQFRVAHLITWMFFFFFFNPLTGVFPHSSSWKWRLRGD